MSIEVARCRADVPLAGQGVMKAVRGQSAQSES